MCNGRKLKLYNFKTLTRLKSGMGMSTNILFLPKNTSRNGAKMSPAVMSLANDALNTLVSIKEACSRRQCQITAGEAAHTRRPLRTTTIN